MISSAFTGSKRGISVSVPAPAIDAFKRARLAERVEQRQRAERDGLRAEVEQSTRDLGSCAGRFACVNSAPFGVPVVPEV